MAFGHASFIGLRTTASRGLEAGGGLLAGLVAPTQLAELEHKACILRKNASGFLLYTVHIIAHRQASQLSSSRPSDARVALALVWCGPYIPRVRGCGSLVPSLWRAGGCSPAPSPSALASPRQDRTGSPGEDLNNHHEKKTIQLYFVACCFRYAVGTSQCALHAAMHASVHPHPVCSLSQGGFFITQLRKKFGGQHVFDSTLASVELCGRDAKTKVPVYIAHQQLLVSDVSTSFCDMLRLRRRSRCAATESDRPASLCLRTTPSRRSLSSRRSALSSASLLLCHAHPKHGVR